MLSTRSKVIFLPVETQESSRLVDIFSRNILEILGERHFLHLKIASGKYNKRSPDWNEVLIGVQNYTKFSRKKICDWM